MSIQNLAFLVILLTLTGCKANSGSQSNSEITLPSVPFDLQFKPAHDSEVGRYFIVTGTVPAQFPAPEREFSAALICGKGGWREVNQDSRNRFEVFQAWADSSGVELSSRGLQYDALGASCKDKGSLRIESDTFPKTMAALTNIWIGEEKLARGVVEEKGEIQFYSSGHKLAIRVSPNQIIGDRGDPPVLEAQGMALARQGKKESPLFFEGKTSNFEYDPTSPVEVIVERHPKYGEPLGFWDVLTLNYRDGWLEWRQTDVKPF